MRPETARPKQWQVRQVRHVNRAPLEQQADTMPAQEMRCGGCPPIASAFLNHG